MVRLVNCHLSSGKFTSIYLISKERNEVPQEYDQIK